MIQARYMYLCVSGSCHLLGLDLPEQALGMVVSTEFS